MEVKSGTQAVRWQVAWGLVWANTDMTVMWSGVNSGGDTGHWSVASSIFTG